MEVLPMEFEEPTTVDDVRNIYREDRPVQEISEATARACSAVLQAEGFEPSIKAVDVAIHSERKYPFVGTVARHNDSWSHHLRQGAVLGPCLLSVELDDSAAEKLRTMGATVATEGDHHTVFEPKGVAFWMKRQVQVA